MYFVTGRSALFSKLVFIKFLIPNLTRYERQERNLRKHLFHVYLEIMHCGLVFAYIFYLNITYVCLMYQAT